jgi:UDP-glucose 4-epimerase
VIDRFAGITVLFQYLQFRVKIYLANYIYSNYHEAMKIKGGKILVTGGLGFIGSHIVESLVHAGAQVRVLDNYSTGGEENLGTLIREIEVIRGDILDTKTLNKAVKGMDAVSHQAAQLEITKALEDPVEDLMTNTVGTLNVFTSCVRHGVSRIINASSAGVYGQAVSVPQEEDSHPTEPNWSYGVSKLANEKYSMIMRDLHGLDITNFRYAIVYGPREWYGRVLTLFLKRALDGKPLIVFGDGKQVRDFVYVHDVVRVHNLALESESAKHQVLNVSTGFGTTISELAETVIKITGENIQIIYEDVMEGEVSSYFERKRLPMELKMLVQSTAKVKRILDYAPTTTLEDGLTAEWEWLKKHQHLWQRMSY